MAPDYSVNTKGPAFESMWEFLITYILTFACIILFVIPFKIPFAHILQNLCQLYIFTGIFVQPLHVGHIVIGEETLETVYRTFQPEVPVILHLPALTDGSLTSKSTSTPTLFVIQEGLNC